MTRSASSQLSVLDLPQLHLHPSATSLLQSLSQLTLPPASWEHDDTEQSTNEIINAKGICAFLTRVIASNLSWLASDEVREKVWDEASARLSERVGFSLINRNFEMPTGRVEEGKEAMVTVKIHEPALVGDNVGHKTWGGSYLLAKRLNYMLPEHFPALKPAASTSSSSTIRILELGAGTGLTGIAASALFPNTITHLTDLPSIVPNLAKNVAANPTLCQSSSITTGVLDWSDLQTQVPAEDKFDAILTADSLYAPEHPRWLANAMALYLKPDTKARVFVELPYREMDREYHQELRDAMAEKGFRCLDQGDEIGVEDWETWNGRVEVKCWWSVWGWK